MVIAFFIYLFIFTMGLAAGSLLNALIWRLKTGESMIVKPDADQNIRQQVIARSQVRLGDEAIQNDLPANNGIATPRPSRRAGLAMTRNVRKLARSYCPHCRATLRWYDLVPVLSFVFLRGKCRHCNKKISIQYPLVEIMTAALFIMMFFWMPNFNLEYSKINFGVLWILDIGYWIFIASSLIVIFVYDLKHYLIPDKILLPAIIVSFIYRVYETLVTFQYRHAELVSASQKILNQVQDDKRLMSDGHLLLYFLSALMASGFFLSLFLLSKGKWIGFGDVKLAFLMGLILGWPGILVALFTAYFLGAVVGLGLILASISGRISGSPTSVESRASQNQSYSLKSQIPFGPFLISGTFIALFWGQRIAEWYLGLLF